LVRQARESVAKLVASEGILEGRKRCRWVVADDEWSHWVGTCGVAWSLDEGTPVDHGMRFCPRCGGELVQQSPRPVRRVAK
jgi:hypothetical protein